MTAMQERIYRVTGRVQGVYFRASTREQALQLGLTGYAKNLADGAVEVLACGSVPALDGLAAWLWQGPAAAHVTEVKLIEQRDAADQPRGFVTL